MHSLRALVTHLTLNCCDARIHDVPTLVSLLGCHCHHIEEKVGVFSEHLDPAVRLASPSEQSLLCHRPSEIAFALVNAMEGKDRRVERSSPLLLGRCESLFCYLASHVAFALADTKERKDHRVDRSSPSALGRNEIPSRHLALQIALQIAFALADTMEGTGCCAGRSSPSALGRDEIPSRGKVAERIRKRSGRKFFEEML